jgi:hypothetical protein
MPTLETIQSLDRIGGAPIILNPNISVYRPWVWIELPSGDSTSLRINYPGADSIDRKFRWLKDFQWSLLNGGRGSSLSFTIFDNRGDMNQKWMEIIQRNVLMQGISDDHFCKFQWGWAPRLTGSFPDNSEQFGTIPPQPYSSEIHRMYVQGVDMEYVEGGINYRFYGVDAFTPALAVSFPEKLQDMSFELAIDNVKKYLIKNKIIHEQFVFDITPDFKEQYDITQKVSWGANNHSVLSAIQAWLAQITPKKIDKTKPKVGPTMKPMTNDNRIGVQFDVSVQEPSASNFIFGNRFIHVNPPDSVTHGGVGRHTAISMKPSFSGGQAWMFHLNSSVSEKKGREIYFTSDDPDGTTSSVRGGMSSHTVSPGPDSVQTGKNIQDSQQKTVDVMPYTGSHFQPEKIELELVGIPFLDKIDMLGKFIKLRVWNPAYANDDTQTVERWVRTPAFDVRYPEDNYILGITHIMNSEGSYTTVLTVVPQPVDEHRIFGGK